MLRQAENKVYIEGTLSQINLEYKSYVKNGTTVEGISGTIDVKVNLDKQVLTIPVHAFANKYTKTGNINPSFESLEKAKRELVSIAACGDEEKADKVRINGDIRMNDFTGKDGRLISQPRINTSFVNKVYGAVSPAANFSLEFMVQNIAPVVDREGVEVEPKKVNVIALVPQYGGLVDVMTLTANAPSVINAVEQHWEPGFCYKASGVINFTSTTEEYEEHVDFGEPLRKVRTINLSELVITGGSGMPMDDNLAFSKEDIKAGLDRRAAMIEERKIKAESRKAPAPIQNSQGNGAPFDLGF